MKTSKFFFSTLVAAAAMTATAWADHTFSSNENVTISQNTRHDSVSVGQGVEGAFVFDGNNKDLWIGNLKLEGNLVVSEDTCDLAEIGSISGSGSLTLLKRSPSSWGGALVLSGDSTGYAGTINIWNGNNEGNNPGQYSQFLVLKSANAAGSATVNLGAATVLMISANETAIGGLNSQGSASSVVSRASSFGYGADNGGAKVNPYHTSYSGDNPVNDGTHRTLNITGNEAYEFKGTFGSSTNIGSLSLNWSGSGSQTFSGNTFVNNLTVSAGSISLTGANTAIAGDITVSAGSLSLTGEATTIGGSVENSGTLTLGGVVTLFSGITNTGTVVLNDGITFDLGGFNFTDGENAIVSGGTVTDGITSANFQNVGVMRGGSFSVNSTTSSLSLTLTQGVAGTLAWSGVAGAVWNTSTDNDSVWTLSGGETSSFYFKDNVIFDANATNKTVKLESGNTVTVGTATVSGGRYIWDVQGGTKPAVVSGSTLTIDGGATLRIGNDTTVAGNRVELSFDEIILGGVLEYNSQGTTTWSSLEFKEGGNLHIVDATGGTPQLTIDSVSVSGNATITSAADKSLQINALSGDKNLTVTGANNWGEQKLILGSLSDYSGTLTLNDGASGLGVSINTKDIGTTAKVVINDGVVLTATSSAVQNTTVDMSNVSGAGTVLLKLKADNGAGFNLSNFAGTIEVDNADGQGSGCLQLNTSTLNTSSLIKVLDGGQLVFNDNSNKDVSNDITVVANSTIHVNPGCLGTLSGTINATGTVTKEGAGTLTLTGEANIAKITVSSGTLNVGDGGVLTVTGDDNGTSEISGTLNVTGGGTLKFGGHDALGYNNRNASGTVIAQGASSEKLATILFNDTGKLTLSKEIQLKGNTVVKNADGNSNSIKAYGGQFTASGANNTISTAFDMSEGKVDFSVAQDGSLTVDSVISGSKSWDKLGGGTLTLKGNNSSYSGAITVSAGTVVAAHANALGTGAVTLNGGDLDVRANVTINELNGVGADALKSDIVNESKDEYTLRVGKGDTDAGIVGFTKHTDGSTSYTLSLVKFGDTDDKLALRNYLAAKNITVEGGTLSWAQEDINGEDNWGSVEEDLLVKSEAQFELVLSNRSKEYYAFYVGGDVNLASGAKIVVDLSNVTADGEEIVLNIIAANAINFDWSETPEASIATEGSSLEDFVEVKGKEHNLAAYVNQVWSYSEGVLSLTLAIPEPSLFGVLAGLGALALVGTRRRRKKA